MFLNRGGGLMPTRIEWCQRNKVITKFGYVLIWKPNYPNANIGKGYILEHRYVMSEHLRRPLRANEHIHHINGDKSDNRIDNLQLLTNSEHRKLHMENDSEVDIQRRTKYLNDYAKRIKIKRETVICACGCGGEFITPDSKGRFHKYLLGHNTLGRRWKWKKNAKN
jgi:hypothetical protein